MPKRTKDHRSWLLSELEDQDIAANYINAALDDSLEMFLVALRNVAETHRMAKIAEEAGVSRESLYRTLSKEGNPCLDTLTAILQALGLRIIVEAVAQSSCPSGSIHEGLGQQLARVDTLANLGSSIDKLSGVERLIATPQQNSTPYFPLSHANN